MFRRFINRIFPSDTPSVSVFLGGACNPTTWRKDTAIPILEHHNISYYNPQVDEWHDGLIVIENSAKNNAKVLLFVVDSATRGYATIAEAAYYIGKGRKVVLVIQKPVENQTIGGNELKDIQRGRDYLLDIAKQNNVAVFTNVHDAVIYITQI